MTLAVLPFFGPIFVSESLVALVTICTVYLLLRLTRARMPEGLQPLPGPKSLPFIGNVMELGWDPHLSLTAMSKQFGPVFKICIGSRPVVVLSGSETVRQALIKQGDEFAGRPDLHSFRFINDGKSLAFSTDQSRVWRARRKLAHNALRSFATLEGQNPEYSCTLEEHISKEGLYLVDRLHSVTEANGCFDAYRHIVVSVANVICGMCFGRRYSHDHEELVSLVNLSDEFSQVVGSGNLADFIPFLRLLPSKTMDKFLDINSRFSIFVQGIVKEHYETYDKNNIRDITDSLIHHCEDRRLDKKSNVQLSDDKIVGIVNDLFGAGIDTVSTALSWSIMYLVTYPKIQEKLHQELMDTIGMDRTPHLSDKTNLPYLESFITEVFRHSSFIPFTIPHCTTADTSLNGYFIPKDTCVFINQWQMNHDPEQWKEPSLFNPDRFLSTDSGEHDRTKAEKVMVFSLGKRRCVGEAIARAEIFLFLAILIQRLKFSSLPGKQPDMTPVYGLFMKHKRCLLRTSPWPGFETSSSESL
ncbi:cytochrome P450 1A1-like [Salminus brasiliensis]|uniref:cytochrome P450 1A1-like n=1 Tax=Salminus brasiliensis TaxID=930266 RepID=UPI003B838A76